MKKSFCCLVCLFVAFFVSLAQAGPPQNKASAKQVPQAQPAQPVSNMPTTPQIKTYPNGYRALVYPESTVNGVKTYANGYREQIYPETTVNGIKTYANGYSERVYTPETVNGVTTYANGYSTRTYPETTVNGVKTYPNGYSERVYPESAVNGTKTYVNGYTERIYTPSTANGVMTYTNGYWTPVHTASTVNGVKTYANGYSTPVNNGYTQPANNGYTTPVYNESTANGTKTYANGYTMAVSNGYTLPANNGYALPANNGYTKPQATYTQPQTQYTPANAQYTVPPATYTQPQSQNVTPQGQPTSEPTASSSPNTAGAFDAANSSRPFLNLVPPANNNMAGTTPMLNNSGNPSWLKLSQLPQALNGILADVSKSHDLPLKLESYTDTQFGGLKVAEYRITPDASIDLNGVAGTLKVLQKVDDAATIYSIYDNAKSEFESRGITGSSLINAWVASPQSVVFAFQNPDAGIQALTEGFTSASAVSIRFASFGLVEVHGPDVEQFVNKIAK